MEAQPLGLEGLILVSPRKVEDTRGFFFEAWRSTRFNELVGRTVDFVQDNVSFSLRNVVRGLHFQRAPHEQGKLVSVLAGSIYDVAVDLRIGSPTYSRHCGVELSAYDHRMLWIPEGFAHGFLVLSENAVVHYKTTSIYSPQSEGAVRWNDPELGILWPTRGQTPVLSTKDAEAPSFEEMRSRN